MKTAALLFLLAVTSVLVVGESQQSLKPAQIFQSFLMTVSEDGREQRDYFELWELLGEFGGARSSCSIQVASFVVGGETRVNLWNHTAQRVTEVRPGIFKVEMNGRFNEFTGLDVVVELSTDRTRIVEMSGSMRSGTRGQSIRVFRVDRKSENRRLRPLRNPSWLLENR